MTFPVRAGTAVLERGRENAAPIWSGTASLPGALALRIYRLMVRTRVLEERLLRMSKSGEGYFWVGGPGEEAFNICLGLQVKKGCGPAYDYLHLHYRSGGVLLAMGMTPVDAVRQMAMRVTDSHSRGRNFVSHFARREWNVLPVNSVIEIQYAMAAGTALVQKRSGGDGITIVTGGDAGTAEGDFASCLVWSTRPGNEVPVLLIVTNNGWGISTPAGTQQAPHSVVERGKAFGISGRLINGNDPVVCWHALAGAMAYCRRQRRPYLLEARVARLYGHTSSSGGGRIAREPDCIEQFQHKLLTAGILDQRRSEAIVNQARVEVEAAVAQALREPQPAREDLYRDTYARSPVDAVYPDDYTGLPAGAT